MLCGCVSHTLVWDAVDSNFDVELQEVRAGFTWGEVHITPLLESELEEASQTEDLSHYSTDPNTTMVIPFQNENLYAYCVKDGNQTVPIYLTPAEVSRNDAILQVVASVPDLITVLDSQSGTHLGTPEC
jgi:DUF917 family protein